MQEVIRVFLSEDKRAQKASFASESQQGTTGNSSPAVSGVLESMSCGAGYRRIGDKHVCLVAKAVTPGHRERQVTSMVYLSQLLAAPTMSVGPSGPFGQARTFVVGGQRVGTELSCHKNTQRPGLQ